MDFFAKIKYGNVEAYLPHRDREGYGFHIEAIEELATRDVKLIITVDVGTNAIDAVQYAKKLGVDVIVTDHHELSADPVRSDASNGADARASLSEVTPLLFKEVSCLAPFGMGNLKPVFLVTGATVSAVRAFGRTNNHVEVLLSCARTGVTARAFDFFKTAESFTHAPQAGNNVNILATIERDSYRGGLALRIVDIIPAS